MDLGGSNRESLGSKEEELKTVTGQRRWRDHLEAVGLGTASPRSQEVTDVPLAIASANSVLWVRGGFIGIAFMSRCP